MVTPPFIFVFFLKKGYALGLSIEKTVLIQKKTQHFSPKFHDFLCLSYKFDCIFIMPYVSDLFGLGKIQENNK